MKKEKGITLMSLVIYVFLMIIMVGIMSSITINFSENMDELQGNVKDVIEFGKFNNFFIKEVKTTDNKVDHISDKSNYILFTTGNSFSIINNEIYYNNTRICQGVETMQISLGKNGDGLDKSIVNVTLNFKSFNKSINYKIENIY